MNLAVGLYMHSEEASFGEKGELKGLEMMMIAGRHQVCRSVGARVAGHWQKKAGNGKDQVVTEAAGAAGWTKSGRWTMAVDLQTRLTSNGDWRGPAPHRYQRRVAVCHRSLPRCLLE